MMKLSIIVPVYNVSKYLSKCLDSLICQDIDNEDYEIIVVNDGSTDDSGEIARMFAGKYSNIILINQENQGLSGARNAGIKAAKGKYIQFVDSDDYLEPNVEKALVEKMEKENLDILRFNYQNVNEYYNVFIPYKDYKPFVDYRDEITDGLTFLTERLGYACYAVQFMIKSELLKKEENLFKRGIYFEDTEWTPRIMTQADRVTSVDTVVYNYLLRDGSISRSISLEKKRKVVEDKLKLVESMKSQMSDKRDKRWYEGMVAFTVVTILDAVASEFYSERRKYIEILRDMKLFPLSKYHITKRMQRKIKLVNLQPEIYCLMMKVRK